MNFTFSQWLKIYESSSHLSSALNIGMEKSVEITIEAISGFENTP